jgi:rubrerythrin
MRIRRLVAEIDEQHREAMRTITDDFGERHFGARTPEVEASRRRFVRNLGLGSVAAVGVASAPTLLLASPAAAQSSSGSDVEIPDADLAIVEFAVGLELAAETAYSAAVATKLLDSAQAELAHTFGRHHHEHAVALATLAGRDADTVGFPDPTIVNELSPQIEGAADANAVLQVLFGVEEGAAATYLQALGDLESRDVAALAGTILPVEGQHATAIGSLLALPVDEWMPPFQTTDGAYAG